MPLGFFSDSAQSFLCIDLRPMFVKTLLPRKMNYSLKFAVTFGAVSALAAFMMTSMAFKDESWESLWVFAGAASFLVAFALSYGCIATKENCSTPRLVIVGTLIAILSHWLCWYAFLVGSYIQWKFLGDVLPFEPVNPFIAVGMAFGYTLFSLAFLGWVSLPISIFLSTWLNREGS
jgi:hypothetical protein